MSLRTLTCLALLTVLLVAAFPQLARAATFNACTAADIIGHEASCPNSATPCSISNNYNIVMADCDFDFSGRDVTIKAGTTFNIGGNSVSFEAHNFTMEKNTYLDGRGNSVTAGDVGGYITINASGAVDLQRQASAAGKIDVDGATQGGVISISAGTSINIVGRLRADALAGGDAAGCILLTAGTSVTIPTGATISANGGVGDVNITAVQNVTIAEPIELDGEPAGTLEITTGGTVTLADVSAKSTADNGTGGAITVVAGTSATLNGAIAVSTIHDGTAGSVAVATLRGDLLVADDILAEDTLPLDSGGTAGMIALVSQGHINIQATSNVSARGDGLLNTSGGIALSAELGITVNGTIDTSDGGCGGPIDIDSTADVTINGLLTSSGHDFYGYGGAVSLWAGDEGQGSLVLNNKIDTTGGPCDIDDQCGVGGNVNLEGCNVTITAMGSIDARAPDGSSTNTIIAHKQLTISGPINMLATGGSDAAADGDMTIDYRAAVPATITGLIQPAATINADATCTAFDTPTGCLDPCPTCGNGMTEWPEECDGGAALHCTSGCSQFCRTQNCNDNYACTVDTCDEVFGCRNLDVTTFGTPCPTNTPAPPTNTPSRTPTQTPTYTLTPLLAVANAAARPNGPLCLAASLSNGASPLVTSNGIGDFTSLPFTPVFSAVAINPAIGAGTAPNKHVDRNSNSGVDMYGVSGTNMVGIPDGPLYTATYIVPADAPAAVYALAQPPPGFQIAITNCTGDCDGSGTVSVGEVQRCANKFLGQPLCSPANPSLDCPVADTDGNGSESLGEVQQCVNRMLNGCP